MLALVEEEELGHVAQGEGAVLAVRVAGDPSDRHLLEEGGDGARPGRIRRVAEAVVVVEDADDGERGVHGLEVEIGPVEVVLAPEVLQRGRRGLGVDPTGHGDVVGRTGLIDVVTEGHDEVDIGLRVERPGGQVRV